MQGFCGEEVPFREAGELRSPASLKPSAPPPLRNAYEKCMKSEYGGGIWGGGRRVPEQVNGDDLSRKLKVGEKWNLTTF